MARTMEVREDVADTTDDLLVDRILAGCRRSEGELFIRYQRFMIAIARRQGTPAHEADDCVQSAWMKAMRNLTDLRERHAFRPWLGVITRNHAMSLMRARSRQMPSMALLADQASTEPEMDSHLILSEERAALNSALDQLSPSDRRLLEMLFVEEQSYRRVAKSLGWQIGSIGPKRGRSLARLRQAYLDQIEPDEELASIRVCAPSSR